MATSAEEDQSESVLKGGNGWTKGKGASFLNSLSFQNAKTFVYNEMGSIFLDREIDRSITTLYISLNRGQCLECECGFYKYFCACKLNS